MWKDQVCNFILELLDLYLNLIEIMLYNDGNILMVWPGKEVSKKKTMLKKTSEIKICHFLKRFL